MFPRILTAAAAVAAFAGTTEAPAQVLRELAPIEMEYEVRIQGAAEPAGTASASFRPVDTRRGRRLEVRTRMDFTLGEDPSVEYHETAVLTCDARGVEKFETVRRFGALEETYLGIRTATDYAITATVGGEVSQKTETGEVQRSNLGLFCGGFLETTLDGGELIVDYPLLFPTQGRHFPRQKVRVETLSVAGPDGPLDVIHSRLRKLGGKRDDLWHRDDEHQALLRMVETADFGTLVISIVTLNGEDVSGWAESIAAAFPQ